MRVLDLTPQPIQLRPYIPMLGLFWDSHTRSVCVKNEDGEVRMLGSAHGPDVVWHYEGESKPPSEPCGWCGHPFVQEGKRRVCANCGGPRMKP